MPTPAPKSPLAAAIATLVLPGLGHLYAGFTLRALFVFVLSNWLPYVSGPRPWLFFSLLLLTRAAAIWDSWRCALRRNDIDTEERASGRVASRYELWSWAAARSLWSVLLMGYFTYGCLSSLLDDGEGLTWASSGYVLFVLFFAALFGFIGWYGTRETWRVLSGQETRTPSSLNDEAGVTALVFGVVGLMLAIVWPYFSELPRKSAEGAAKGRLASVRDAVEAYRRAHEGRPPERLEDLVADGRLTELPRLWSKSAGVPHRGKPVLRRVFDPVSDDSGGYALVVSSSSIVPAGTVFIDCTHTDTRGRVWSAY